MHSLFLAPTRPPDSLEAYASGPSTISITWDPVPLPFIHGQHRGYKIQISNNGQELIVNMTSPNITSFEYNTLQALTNYSISVLAFNDAGDGPYSRVYVKTMPQSKSNNLIEHTKPFHYETKVSQKGNTKICALHMPNISALHVTIDPLSSSCNTAVFLIKDPFCSGLASFKCLNIHKTL